MDVNGGVADLHVHTTTSDGTATIDERVTDARNRGLDAIAITDHDVIASELDTRVRQVDGVELITGLEVQANLYNTKIEILGYYVDPADDCVKSLLERAREYRRVRNRRLVENVTKRTSFDVSYAELREAIEGQVGRPDVARELVKRDIVSDVAEAFERHLGIDGDCYVPMERVDVGQVLDSIHGAGGVTSLAHPGRIRADAETVKQMIVELTDRGVDGIEVRYPYGMVRSDEYVDFGVPEAQQFAENHSLLPTGGSDCHGPDSGKYRLGDVRVDSSTLASIRERAVSREPLD